MGRYAANTDVTADRSKAEIERTLTRYGASSFAYAWEDTRAMIGFRFEDRAIRFVLPLPSPQDPEFTRTPGKGQERSREAAAKAWEQATRQKWRALALAIKAKLEVVESGIRSFEQEFGLDIVMPDGRTVAEHVLPKIAGILAGGKTTRLLPTFAGEE